MIYKNSFLKNINDLGCRSRRIHRFRLYLVLLCGVFLLTFSTALSQSHSGHLAALSQTQLTAKGDSGLSTKVDTVVEKVLNRTGVPSASIAVVKNGKIVYSNAYGDGRLHPKVKANTNMRYAIGSISKQFAAASLLMLKQKGKISLDDHVSKWLPDLTKANKITVREILSHTSGYQDYWPQRYVPPFLRKDEDPLKIIHKWAEKPLDFEPGTKWQYSNTNYMIAGQIIKQITGQTTFEFVKQHILKPLHITNALNYDTGEMTKQDAKGYIRHGLGPLRPSIHEGKGWISSVGELAMTPRNLAKWDISIINESLLNPRSYKQFEKEVLLKDSMGSGYALGVFVSNFDGHRNVWHDGEVSGFMAENFIFPDDGAAVVVLTNQMAGAAANSIARKIAKLLFAKQATNTEKHTKKAQNFFINLQKGTINRSLLSHDADVYFSKQAVNDFKSSLRSLGKPEKFEQTSQFMRGGMIGRNYRAVFPHKTLLIFTYHLPSGKLEQYQIAPAN